MMVRAIEDNVRNLARIPDSWDKTGAITRGCVDASGCFSAACTRPRPSGLETVGDEIADGSSDFLSTPGFHADVRAGLVGVDRMGERGRANSNEGGPVDAEGKLLRHPIGRGSDDLEVVIDGGTRHVDTFDRTGGAMQLGPEVPLGMSQGRIFVPGGGRLGVGPGISDLGVSEPI